jgi:hypothetical protein
MGQGGQVRWHQGGMTSRVGCQMVNSRHSQPPGLTRQTVYHIKGDPCGSPGVPKSQTGRREQAPWESICSSVPRLSA